MITFFIYQKHIIAGISQIGDTSEVDWIIVLSLFKEGRIVIFLDNSGVE